VRHSWMGGTMHTSIGMWSVRILLAALSIGVAVSSSRAATIIVPDDNPSLPAAVAAASAGDTIQVRPGDYPDRVTVSAGQDFLTIEGLGGRPRFPGANRKEGFRVKDAAGVLISGFDFEKRLIAVRLTDCTNCVVVDIAATGCRDAVRVKRSSGVVIGASTFMSVTRGRAIWVDESPGALLAGNSITDVRRDGIRLTRSPGSIVTGNTIAQASRGIFLKASDNATLAMNSLSASRREGVSAGTADGVILDNNAAVGSGTDGYVLNRLTSSVITNNDAIGNGRYGFQVLHSPPFATDADLTAAGNTASGNLGGDFRIVP
jgi:parallel beta-helix repeat protein